MYIKYIVLLFFSFLSLFSFTQSNLKMGLLPRIQLKTELTEKLSLTNIIETRHFFYDYQASKTKHFTYELTDFSAFFEYQFNNKLSANIAYTLRVEPYTQSHRFIQQFKISNNFSSFSLRHRFGIDQTFNKHKFAVFRTRYLLSFIKPLEGKILDNNEFYFKQGLEFVGDIEHKKAGLEIRIIPKLGYQLNVKNFFELGLDYRFNNFISDDINNVLWYNITWSTKINPKDKRE